jgi:dTDP-4-amino-4,6-dideoxygalactose transaminase
MLTTARKKLAFGQPMIGEAERQAVADVLAGPILVHGPRADQFERDFAAFTGAPHAVSVSNCTAGMHLVYFALGYGPGDEVIVPAMTHTATAHAVALTGATPVFVDCERATGNIDIDAIAAKITPRTRAICVVHYLGMPVDMARVNAIAKKHNLFVLEDAALAVGSKLDGVHAGLLGDAGVFSFYPVKHITTAEGGMVISRHEDLARKVRSARAFGIDRTHGERKAPGVYDAVGLGFNYRMSEIHAAIGIEQVKRIPSFLEQRRKNDTALRKLLTGDNRFTLFETTGGRFLSSYYCHSIMLREDLAQQRPQIIAAINEKGVGTSVYYPAPVPRMTYYREKYGYDANAYKNAAWVADCTIALPVAPHLAEEDMVQVAEAVKESVR